MTEDTYAGLAERYDWMKTRNPVRSQFFRDLLAEHNTTRVLDCACGTGRDLLLFHALGLEVYGSDLSDSMLAQARKTVGSAGISLQKLDYRELPEHYDVEFDAVLCLSNSINEPLRDAETLRALRSMRSVLRPGGILVFDQGQTDASMRNPPRFAPILNSRDFTTLFTMAYADDVMTVNIFDFIHTDDVFDFRHSSVRIRIRLLDSWLDMLHTAGFETLSCFGNWAATPYDKQTSPRLIVVAEK